MDRFDALRAFARVVEAGSFTKAAQTLHLSKTTVTQLIQQLEARLRVKLLNRTTRQVRVTEDGAAYYERVVRVLAELDDADTSLSTAAAAPKGRLRIDLPSPFARLILVPALPDFHARYPEIQLDLGVSDRMVDVIGDNVDAVLRGGALTDSSLTARRIGELPLGLYAAPDYLARVGSPTHPAALDEDPHRLVGYLSSRTGRVAPIPLRRERDGMVEAHSVHGRYVVALDDGNAYLAAGLAGLGVLWLPRYMADAHVDRGELVPLLEDWHAEAMPMFLAYPSNRHVSAKLRVFIEWVDALMRRHAPVAGLGEGRAPARSDARRRSAGTGSIPRGSRRG